MNKSTALSKRIRQAREQAGLTQEDLARLVGVSSRTVVWWESGLRTPKPETLARLEELLCSPC